MRRSLACSALILSLLIGCGGGGGDNNSAGGGGGTTPPPSSNVPAPPAPPTSVPQQWWNQAVFYEVFVRSFADSELGSKSNDGIGDFDGLIERLDYLNDGDPNTTDDLGITAVWLMPIMDSPSYHGYDVTDYFKIEPDYGSNNDFKRFIDAAHARGIKVIIDLVLNHASNQHPRFLDSRQSSGQYRDWFIWNDTNPGFLGPWGQTVWHRSGSSYYYGLFWSGMPDWNYETPEVTDYMREVTQFWLDDMGVDGFRLDAIRYLYEEGSSLQDIQPTHDWLSAYKSFYKSVDTEAMTVGEVWAASDIVASYRDDMDLSFQFDLATAILEAADNGNGSRLESELNRVWNNFDPSQFATFITNHDQDRVMSQLGGSQSKASLAGTILLTIPGVPFIYYGEEIGMQGSKPDELIRRPLQWSSAANAGFTLAAPWQAPNSDYSTVNIGRQGSDSTSLLSLYRRLIHLRNGSEALRRGDLTLVQTSTNSIVAFLRQTPNDSVLVILNLGAGIVTDYNIGLDAAYDGATELLHGVDVSKGSVLTVNGLEGYKPLERLSARTGYVIQL